jgi:hypothetical protein
MELVKPEQSMSIDIKKTLRAMQIATDARGENQ